MEVFVYGTLTDPSQAEAVLEDFTYRGPAALSGLHRVEGQYPTLAPGGSVTGRLLATDDVAALDRYEGIDNGLYVRVAVPVADDATGDHGETVETYVGNPDRMDASAEWPDEGSFMERARAYVAENDVAVEPIPDGTFADFGGYAGDVERDATADHDAWGLE